MDSDAVLFCEWHPDLTQVESLVMPCLSPWHVLQSAREGWVIGSQTTPDCVWHSTHVLGLMLLGLMLACCGL